MEKSLLLLRRRTEKQEHPFYDLLLEMRQQSGDAVLDNTSFNTNGEPIVCDLKDACHCFLETDIDILVAGNNAFIKSVFKSKA